MKIKILQTTDHPTMEIVYNEFAQNNNVHFTQSHFKLGSYGGIYVMFVYYTDKAMKQ